MSDDKPLSILSNYCHEHLQRLTPQGCLACENEKLQGRISALEEVMHHVAAMLIGCEDEDKYLQKMVLAVLEEQ